MMKKLFGVIFTAALLLTACSSTPLKKVWVAPDAKPITFQRTLIMAVGPSEAIRRSSEEALVRDMYPLRGEEAYKIMDEEKLTDVEKTKAFVKSKGFDGALVVKYLGTRQEVRSTPNMGPYHGGFYGYFRHPFPFYAEMSTVDTRNISSVEMTIFALQDDSVVWTGYMEINTPRDVDTAVSRLSIAAIEDLRARGLLAK